MRPYRLNEEEMIDLDLITRISLFQNQAASKRSEKWQLVISMYYAEPIILYFSTRAEATMRMNALFELWKQEEKKAKEEQVIVQLTEQLNSLDDMFNKIIKGVECLFERVEKLENKTLPKNDVKSKLDMETIHIFDRFKDILDEQFITLLTPVSEVVEILKKTYPNMNIEIKDRILCCTMNGHSFTYCLPKV